MLNYIWAFMIIISILVASFTGRLQEVTQAALNSSKEAVMFCIGYLGVISLWIGLMSIGEKAGLISKLTKKMKPILSFLFPDIPDGHPAQKYIATNIIANILGLGWAATPPGLKAMSSLQDLNKNKMVATKSMCTFLIINISSVQLLPITIIAYRLEYNSKNPTEIIGPALVATAVSTIVGIIFAKIMWSISKD